MPEEIDLTAEDERILDRIWFNGDSGPMPGAACHSCGNYIGGGKCLAFRAGIPHPILAGSNRHREPFPGDGGIRYQPADSPLRRLDRIARYLGIKLRADK